MVGLNKKPQMIQRTEKATIRNRYNQILHPAFDQWPIKLVTRYSSFRSFYAYRACDRSGEINQMNPLLFCLQKLWKTGLFHQLFEPLTIHQTISNSNQTIHKTLYLMKMDKSGPKNNNFGSLIWKSGNGVLTTGFRYFPKLSRCLYAHKAIRLAAKHHKFEIKQFLCLLFSYFIGQILPRTILTTEYVVKMWWFSRLRRHLVFATNVSDFSIVKNHLKTNQKHHKT